MKSKNVTAILMASALTLGVSSTVDASWGSFVNWLKKATNTVFVKGDFLDHIPHCPPCKEIAEGLATPAEIGAALATGPAAPLIIGAYIGVTHMTSAAFKQWKEDPTLAAEEDADQFTHLLGQVVVPGGGVVEAEAQLQNAKKEKSKLETNIAKLKNAIKLAQSTEKNVKKNQQALQTVRKQIESQEQKLQQKEVALQKVKQCLNCILQFEVSPPSSTPCKAGPVCTNSCSPSQQPQIICPS